MTQERDEDEGANHGSAPIHNQAESAVLVDDSNSRETGESLLPAPESGDVNHPRIGEAAQITLDHIHNGTLDKRAMLRVDLWDPVGFTTILQQICSGSSKHLEAIHSLAIRRQAMMDQRQRTPQDLEQLFQALATLPSLKTLTLTWFHEPEDLRVVSSFLGSRCGPGQLNLRANLREVRVRSDSLPQQISDALSTMPCLDFLEVCYLDRTMTDLLPLLQSPTLRSLEVNIYGTGDQVVDPAHDFLHALGDGEELGQQRPLLRSLTSLSMDGFRGQVPELALLQLIRNNKTLQSLEFHNSDLPGKETENTLYTA
jgi:hypothetical protein